MVILFDGEASKIRIQEKRRKQEAFQEDFKTKQIPVPVRYVDAIAKEAEFPYPPQVMVIGMLFPVPVPASCVEPAIEKYVIKREGKNVLLKQPDNFLICFKTSSGKTFVIKLFMIKNLERGVAVYTCPLKALAEEKFMEFSDQFPWLNISILTGDYSSSSINELERSDIMVTTFEKLDSMLQNHKNDVKSLVGSVVVDEIHVMDGNRGGAIEDLISKIKEIETIPIMATSASVGKTDIMGKWLHAVILESDFRPVPLKKGVLIGTEIEYENHEFEQFDVPKTNNVSRIIAKKVMDGEQVMYVRMSRKATKSFASKIASKLRGSYYEESLELPLAGSKRKQPANLIELDRCIKYGVAWHHAGLPIEVKSYIEKKFREGKIRFIASTTTLASGINLPARYVFMDWKRFNGKFSEPISNREVTQILGRAGRPQYDDEGFGIMVCKKEEDVDYCMKHYIGRAPEPIKSPLLTEDDAMLKSIIGHVGGGYAITLKDLIRVYKKTLAYFQDPMGMINRVKKYLNRFDSFEERIIEKKGDGYYLTPIGEIIKKFYINPNEADIIIQMVKNIEKPTPLAILHGMTKCASFPKLYIKTYKVFWWNAYKSVRETILPVNVNDEEDWRSFQTASVLIGTGYDEENGVGRIIYADEEVGLNDLCYYHGIQSGDLFRIVGQNGDIYRIMAFSRRMATYFNAKEVHDVIREIETRLRYGISKKLVPVCRIKDIGRERGKVFFKLGYCDVETIATANSTDIASIEVAGSKIGLSRAKKIISSAKRSRDR